MQLSFHKQIIKLLRYLLYAPLNWLRYLLRMDSTVPVSRLFGFDRGTSIDRYYIEQFLKKHAARIHGDVLEIAENTYTMRYGTNPVSHVLHAVEGNPNATFVGNLETGENIPQNAYDCMILTQTLPFIYDTRAVIRNCYQALKKGGTILITVPCISQISRYDMDRWGITGALQTWDCDASSRKRSTPKKFPRKFSGMSTRQKHSYMGWHVRMLISNFCSQLIRTTS